MKKLFRRGLLLAVLTIGLAFHLTAQTTQMTIYMNNGEEVSYLMTEDDRMYFEDNETLVIEIAFNKDTRSDRFSLADIRKITCNETENTSETSDNPIYLSPNPVYNAFMLRNLKGKETLKIYALDGRLMKSMEVSENQMVDISDLPIGIYLVKTERQTLKMIKL